MRRFRFAATLLTALPLAACVHSHSSDIAVDSTYHGNIQRLFIYGTPDQGNLPSMRKTYDDAVARNFGTCRITVQIMRRENFDENAQDRLDAAASAFHADAMLITSPLSVAQDNTALRQQAAFGNSLYVISAKRFVWRNRQSLYTRYAPGTNIGKIYADTLFNKMASDGVLGPDCRPLSKS
ncbi:hypothetical protein [Kozakia baliensis]|uniref:hypothetical protein n=1 Tax=Kozakia baliensis TaxID=153496 RepID=UPI0004958BEC|nr:hypothetical protein [Kozakia baliensis]AOX20341.1 hypothetical protein A0U90_08555 [Kozakia baliensis]